MNMDHFHYKSHNLRSAEHMGFLQRFAIYSLLVALLFSSHVGFAKTNAKPKALSPVIEAPKSLPSVVFDPLTRVVLFEPGTGKWFLTEYKQTQPGSEFCYNNQFYRVDDSGKAQPVLNVRANRLFEAGRSYDYTSRPPGTSDIVQVLDKDMRPLHHSVLSEVKSGATVRFQGKAYSITSKKKPTDTGTIFYAADSTLQRIEITKGAMRHITDRHTVSGTRNAGASIFNPDEDIRVLIKNAEIVSPMQSRDKFRRVMDAGHIIGIDTQSGKQTSLYFVITTQAGILVTAYPSLRGD
jgi:hypothetical protein